MSTPTRSTSSPPPRHGASTSISAGLRSRGVAEENMQHIIGALSPTLSTLSNLSETTRGTPSANPMTMAKKITIRADHSLLTCFDPSDKELYDLWAPKR